MYTSPRVREIKLTLMFSPCIDHVHIWWIVVKMFHKPVTCRSICFMELRINICLRSVWSEPCYLRYSLWCNSCVQVFETVEIPNAVYNRVDSGNYSACRKTYPSDKSHYCLLVGFIRRALLLRVWIGRLHVTRGLPVISLSYDITG